MNLKQRAKTESTSIPHCRKISADIDAFPGERLKIAVIGGFTLKGIAECLKAKAYSYGVLIDVYEGEYSQWRQEILGERLYDFNPDIIFIIEESDDTDEMTQYLTTLKQKTGSKIVATDLMGDGHRKLHELFVRDHQVHIIDLERWLSVVGKEHWKGRYYKIADMKISPHALPLFAEELMRYVVPIAGKTKKCIVLDLDNTLWGGIVGEDGVTGIKLALEGNGAFYYKFQEALFDLKRQGFVLAISSHNNERDVKEVFDTHPHMVLRESDFVAMRINWLPKAGNIRSIAEELNIGLDSLVFIDDDPLNTKSVEKVLPMVDTITLSGDPSEYVRVLRDYKGFSKFELTEEDARRTDMYRNNKERKNLEATALDMDSFLSDLGLVIAIKPVDEASLTRSAQLAGKTNQFNLTTLRHTEDDLRKFIELGHGLWTLEVKDKFGDHGMTGLCIVKDHRDHFEIDTFLLSCRILGRRIEVEFLGSVLDHLKQQNPKRVLGRYIPTAKNAQVKEFYKSLNFTKVEEGDADLWELHLNDFEFRPASFITINHFK